MSSDFDPQDLAGPSDPTSPAGLALASLWQWQSGDFSRDSWCPAVNIYRLEDRVEVCFDLAGVRREHLDVEVEFGRLTVRGYRRPPEPLRKPGSPMRILSMEIEHGAFCCAVKLPEQVRLNSVESEYRDGLLWVRLPLAPPG